jgi:hypothetical protein
MDPFTLGGIEGNGILTAAAVKINSRAAILSGSVSLPLSISSFITEGSSLATMLFSEGGKRRLRTSVRWRNIRFRCGIRGVMKRQRNAGKREQNELCDFGIDGQGRHSTRPDRVMAVCLADKDKDEIR